MGTIIEKTVLLNRFTRQIGSDRSWAGGLDRQPRVWDFWGIVPIDRKSVADQAKWI